MATWSASISRLWPASSFDGEAAVFDAGDSVRADAQVYTATQQGLEEHGDDIKKYLAAIQDATQAIVDDEELDGVLETMRSKYSFASLDDDTVAKESLRQSRSLWTAKGTQPLLQTVEDYWVEGYEELVDAGMIRPGQRPHEVDGQQLSARQQVTAED